MIEFKINEIPDGKSQQRLTLDPEQFDLGQDKLKDVELLVNFDKTIEAIRVKFQVLAHATLICDRSLEPFDHMIDRSYEIIFNDKNEEDSEDEHTALRRLNVFENKIRIDKEVRDTILLGIPVKKLHPKYLDENGNPTDFEKVYSDKNYVDPRWEVLKSLKKD